MMMPGMEMIESNTGLFTVIALWTSVWEGLALWKAAMRREKNWFIALLILNVAGILPILYLFLFNDEKNEASEQGRTTAKTEE